MNPGHSLEVGKRADVVNGVAHGFFLLCMFIFDLHGLFVCTSSAYAPWCIRSEIYLLIYELIAL